MYVRMVFFEFKPESIGDAVRLFQKGVIPGAKKQKGYRGANFFVDRQTGGAVAMTFWRNEKDALASEENLFFQEQLAKFLPYFAGPPVREGYEVVLYAMTAPAKMMAKGPATRP
jgi:hypothetical protein